MAILPLQEVPIPRSIEYRRGTADVSADVVRELIEELNNMIRSSNDNFASVQYELYAWMWFEDT